MELEALLDKVYLQDMAELEALLDKMGLLVQVVLDMVYFQDMVELEALNENMREIRNDHLGSNQIMTRGLCLSEHDTVAKQDVAGSVEVTAILCLNGLPSDLTASILAHGMFFNFTYLLLVTMISRLSFDEHDDQP